MWLLIVVIAHLINAIAFLVDKVMLGTVIKNSRVYAFCIGLLSTVVVVLLPFWPSVPEPLLLPLDLLSGILLVLALVSFFAALKRLEASRVIPFIGGMMPVITFVLSFEFLGERLTSSEAVAFLLLVVGGVLITLDPNHPHTPSSVKGWTQAILAAVLFAGSFVLTKYLYSQQPFFEAFIWSRFGMAIASLAMLSQSSFRKIVRDSLQELSFKKASFFVGNQALGALGFFLLNIAISMASVTLVNALQGVQYAFILLFVVAAAGRQHKALKEKLSPLIIAEKVLAIILIAEGLFLLG